MATDSSVLAWKNPKDRGGQKITAHGFAKELDMTQGLKNNNNIVYS